MDTLIYEYPDGNNGAYAIDDLSDFEQEHLKALLQFWASSATRIVITSEVAEETAAIFHAVSIGRQE